MEKLKEKVIAFLKDGEAIRYVIIGVCTTVVSILVYPLLYCGIWGDDANGTLGELLSQAVSILFAFLPNKIFVFRSKRETFGGVIKEFVEFVGTRIGTFLISEVCIFLLVDMLDVNKWIAKFVTVVISFVGNYLFGKFMVFRKSSKKKETENGN